MNPEFDRRIWPEHRISGTIQSGIHSETVRLILPDLAVCRVATEKKAEKVLLIWRSNYVTCQLTA